LKTTLKVKGAKLTVTAACAGDASAKRAVRRR
jgi:hypothetical protein